MLTEKQILALQEPFKFEEHGFFQRNPYILKSAIRARLNRVAPGWILLPPEFVANDESVIVMRGGIQIGDIRRCAVGTGVILRADKDGVLFDGAKLAGMVSKAYKQATSDILPRAAVEFGIGEYLKNKPKSINQDNFAGWLAGLTRTPADPNAWTVENILAWGNKWRATGLSDAQLMKALNITERWTNFKGTVAEADKAVEAFRALQSAFTTPTTDLTTLYGTRTVLECDTKYLEPGDIIIRQSQDGKLTYDEVTSVPVMGTGTFPWRVTVKHLETGDLETLQLGGIAYNNLAAGPKVQAYLNNPKLAHEPAHGLTPKWDPKPAQPVMKSSLPVIRCETRDLDTGDIILQHSKTQSTETRIEVLKYWGQLAVGQFKLTLKYLATGEEKSVIWSNSEHQLVDGPKCKAYAADETLCLKKAGSIYPIWTAVRASV